MEPPPEITYTDAMIFPLQMKDSRSGPGGNAQEQHTTDAARIPSDKTFLCAQCRSPIAAASHVCAINGKSSHTFANPAGAVFHIGCFSAAANLQQVGLPTSEFTWFPGYRWQIVVCATCNLHLGWRYVSDIQFYGLIMSRLIPVNTGSPS